MRIPLLSLPAAAVLAALLALAPARLPAPRRAFQPLAGNGRVAAFSSSGDLVAVSGGAAPVAVFQTRTGLLLRTYPGHTQAVTDLTFAPHPDTVLSTDAAGQVRLWDAETLATLGQWQAPAPLRALAFAPGGGRALLASATACWLWSLHGTEVPTALKINLPAKSSITSAAFGTDGQQVALGFDSGVVLVYQLGQHTQQQKALGVTAVRSLCLLTDTVLAANGTPDLKQWAARPGAVVSSIRLPQALTAVAAEAGGTYLALGFGTGEAMRWNRADKRADFVCRGQGAARQVQFQPGGPLLLATYEGSEPKTWLVP